MRQFAAMNYHTGKRKDDDKSIVIQRTHDVLRVDESKDVEFTFPLKTRYDTAFNTPDGVAG
jgi:hypothetical protein